MALGIPQLRAFVAVVDTAGFSSAAARLGISQSAVSHAVAALERTTGAPVLTRMNPPLPTLLGERLLVHARAALAAVAAVEELVNHRDSGRHGHLVLAAPPTICHSLVPGLLAHWRAEFPNVSISLFEGDDDEVAGWLDGATADLAVLVDAPDLPTGAVPLTSDRFYAVLRTDHPLAGNVEVHIRDLQDDPFLLSSGGCERHIQELHRAGATPFRPAHRVRQLSTLFAMVRTGVGVSVVPGLAAGMEGPDLVLVSLSHQLRRQLVLTGPLHRPWHPTTAALLGSMAQMSTT